MIRLSSLGSTGCGGGLRRAGGAAETADLLRLVVVCSSCDWRRRSPSRCALIARATAALSFLTGSALRCSTELLLRMDVRRSADDSSSSSSSSSSLRRLGSDSCCPEDLQWAEERVRCGVQQRR